MSGHGGARNGAGRPQTNIDTRRMLVLREQGVAMKDIAGRFGVSVWIVRYALNKLKREKS